MCVAEMRSQEQKSRLPGLFLTLDTVPLSQARLPPKPDLNYLGAADSVNV